jgi:hypothetical protein
VDRDKAEREFSDVTPLKDSGEALLCRIPDLDEDIWIPKSQITDNSEVYEGDQPAGTLAVTGWLAEQRGW